MAEHAALLALLACDVSEIDPRDLDQAIREHVKHSPFMPKACELIERADTAKRVRIWRMEQKIPALPGPRAPDAQEQFEVWARLLQHEPVPQHLIDDKPARWLRIAHERGYLRRHDNDTYTQRAQFEATQ